MSYKKLDNIDLWNIVSIMNLKCKCGAEPFLTVQSPKRVYFAMCAGCLKKWISGFLKFYAENKHILSTASRLFKLNLNEIMATVTIYIRQAIEDLKE